MRTLLATAAALALLSVATLASAARPATSASAHRVGEAVEVIWQGKWYDASIIEARHGLYKIHYTGWDTSWDEWVEPSRIRVEAPAFCGGEQVEVLHRGQWVPGSVLTANGPTVVVQIAGRTVKVGASDLRRLWYEGDEVEVEWQKSWWKASIVETRGDLFKIHYTGWDRSWDEWVESPRIRAVGGCAITASR